MGRPRATPTDLPSRLYFRSGGYYYRMRENGREVCTHIGYDKKSAYRRAELLNQQKKRERIETLGRIRIVARELQEKLFSTRANACAYCGATEELGLDHFIPFASGGATAPFNLVIACASCNERKHDKDPAEFLMAVLGVRDAIMDACLAHLSEIKVTFGNEEARRSGPK